MLLLSIVSGVNAETLIYTDRIKYRVRQLNGETLLVALNRDSPIREDGVTFHGHTSWTIDWSYKWSLVGDGRCAIKDVRVDVKANVLLPDLIAGDRETSLKFARFLLKLIEHEMGHVQIAEEAGARIDRSMQNIPPMSNCQALSAEVDRTAHEILRMAAEKNKKNTIWKRSTAAVRAHAFSRSRMVRLNSRIFRKASAAIVRERVHA